MAAESLASTFPWVFPYVDDPALTGSARLGRVPLRPLVELRLSPAGPRYYGLIDSGSEHTLLSPIVAREAGIEGDPQKEIILGIGGGSQRVRYTTTSIKLLRHGDSDEGIEWTAEVGVMNTWRPPYQIILGQVGFFDRFAVCFHRSAQAVLIEPWEHYIKGGGKPY